jgi:hypothetical protein
MVGKGVGQKSSAMSARGARGYDPIKHNFPEAAPCKELMAFTFIRLEVSFIR